MRHWCTENYPEFFRRSWQNSYCCRRWTRWFEFKSWTRLFVFTFVLIPPGKVWIQLFSLQLWVNNRANWYLQFWYDNRFRKMKTQNSKQLFFCDCSRGWPTAPFSVATIPRRTGGRYSFPWIAPLYPWYIPYNAECWARRHQVPFFSLWYDSTWDWTPVSQTITLP